MCLSRPCWKATQQVRATSLQSMSTRKRPSLTSLRSLREMALSEAVQELQQAQEVLASCDATAQRLRERLSQLSQEAMPHPSSFEDISSMQRAELFRVRQQQRIAECEEELERAREQCEAEKRVVVQRQEQVRKARAEVELVRRKQAEMAQLATREQQRRAEEAVDELINVQQHLPPSQKPD